jgi:hypothetical protein
MDADEATEAALLVLLELLLLAVLEAEPLLLPLWDDAALVGVEPVGVVLATFAELAETPPPVAVPVLVPAPEPLSMTAVLRQVSSVPALIVAKAAKAWVPVESLRETIKLVFAWRSTFHVKEVLCWVGNCFMAAWPAPGMSDKK